MNGIGWLDSLWSDLRYASRGLWHQPTFTATALLTLALRHRREHRDLWCDRSHLESGRFRIRTPQAAVGVMAHGELPGIRRRRQVYSLDVLYVSRREPDLSALRSVVLQRCKGDRGCRA